MSVIEKIRNRFGEDRPFFIDDFKVEFADYSRPWIYQTLKRLSDSGDIVRFDAGVYYVPTQTPFGVSRISPRSVIEKRFIKNEIDVYGYYSGLSHENAIGITTQVPNVIELVSNNESAKVRNVIVGNQRVRVRRAKTIITGTNAKILQFLDLVKNIAITELDETERNNLISYVKEQRFSMGDVVMYSSVYPAKTIQNLIESGLIYELAQ
jgi:signal peptidase I